MLQLFHKYQKSVLLLFTGIVIVTAMLTFGITPYGNAPQSSYALKINEQEISQQEFAMEKSRLEDSFRQKFGELYQQLVLSGSLDLQQQAIDNLIHQTLLQQFAKQQDLVVSSQDLQRAIRTAFGENFSRENYQAFLQNTGQTASSYQARVAIQLLPAVLGEVLGDHLNLSPEELESSVKQAETSYSYESYNFDPASFQDQVADPKPEELTAYYQDHASEYELPEKISYQYITLKPADNLSLVTISQDELELYYSDNLEKYKTPEQALVKVLTISRDAQNPAEDQKSKALADALIVKINAGEAFEKAAKDNGLDAKAAEGKWLEKGKSSASFEAEAFEKGAMGVAKLVINDNSYQVIRVEDYKDAVTKPLTAVSEEITKQLQERDVTAYLQVKAEDLLAEWNESGKSLTDFASDKKLTIEKTEKTLAANDELEAVPGLSKLALEQKDLTKQLQSLDDNFYLLEVQEVQASRIPEESEIKAELTSAYKAEKSLELARQKASEFLAAVQADPSKLESLSKELKLSAATRENFKAADQADDIQSPEARKAVLEAKELGFASAAVEQRGKFYVYNILKITLPEADKIKELAKEKKDSMQTELQNIFLQSLLNKLKAEAKIEISPSLI